jgi:multidrug/hemolysin transport system ATP-binding protein
MNYAKNIIEVNALTKDFKDIQAVKGIDFYVEKNSLFAFLGPNGAGKSTTIDMLCTLTKPTSGKIKIDGYTLPKDSAAIRKKVGVVFQNGVLDPLLTVKENLNIRASFYEMNSSVLKEAVNQAVKYARVEDFLDRKYGLLSGGQKRRADIARALVHTPEILFLDEPTTGLDPQTRKSIWDTVKNLQKQQGLTVFLTTHYMEEAANADYICIIDEGRIAAKGTPSELREQYSKDQLIMRTSTPNVMCEILRSNSIAHVIESNTIRVVLDKTVDALPILELCRSLLDGFEVKNGSMDDAFIAITGKELHDDNSIN